MQEPKYQIGQTVVYGQENNRCKAPGVFDQRGQTVFFQNNSSNGSVSISQVVEIRGEDDGLAPLYRLEGIRGWIAEEDLAPQIN